MPPLPAPLTPLVGRDEESARVVALLKDLSVRLVTLSGPGGVGKTRLALRVATTLDPVGSPGPQGPTPFPAGIGFVHLAPVVDTRLVASAIAGSLRISHDDLPAFDAITDTIGSCRMLLVLDNYEQLMPSAPLITDLLTACPGLKVLVTSRSLLRISGEYDVRVAPLAIPSARNGVTLAALSASDAARLFIERSRAILPGGGLSDADAPAIAEICALLDGLPLAIELAAARVAILSPAMLAQRLDQRLPLLTGGARDLPARQQTLRGAIAWSDDLLPPAERWLFHRLAVFSGGFALEAAAALLGDSPYVVEERGDTSLSGRALEYVSSLMGHSLLLRLDPAGGAPRFGMLGTLREYATECLQADGDDKVARRQHAEYVLGVARQAMDEFSGPHQRLWIERIEADHDNVRAALSWALEHDPETALQLAAALWRFWEIRGFLLEGRSWLERALATPAQVPEGLRATALNNLGNLTYRLADFANARELYQRSLAINRELNDQRAVADSLNNLGLVTSAQGDYVAGRAFLQESLNLRRQQDQPARLSLGLHNLGEMEIEAGDAAKAIPLLDEALELRQCRGDDRGAAYVRYNLGRAALARGDLVSGEAGLREALTIFREVGEKIGTADCLIELGLLALSLDDAGRGVDSLEEGLLLRIDLGDKRGVIAGLEAVAHLAASRGNLPAAARLMGASSHHRDVLHIPPPGHGQAERRRVLDAIERSLGQTSSVALQAESAGWTLSQALDAAFAELARDPAPATMPQGHQAAAASLTARERDVLRLIVQGLANREIAAELSISPRTVSTHVTNILHKLDESSRTGAAAYAVRHGLT